MPQSILAKAMLRMIDKLQNVKYFELQWLQLSELIALSLA